MPRPAVAILVVVAAALSVVLGVAGHARAQGTEPACIAASSDTPADPLVAAEQAVCWIERARTSEACDDCVANAARHCDHASLDLGAQVANACFVARVLAGRYDDAARVLPLLTETWPEVERCRRALSSGLGVRIRADRGSGEVLVNGRSMGSTPTLVELPHPFWEARVAVRFGSGATARTVEADRDAWLASFDRRRCTLAEIVVAQPSAPTTPATSRRHASPRARTSGTRSRPRATRARTSHDPGSPWPAIAAGTGGLVIGGVGAALLGVAGSTASDLRDARDGTPWSPARMDDYDSATSMRAIGGALVGVGATALVIGLALWIADVAGGDDHGMDERGR